MQEVRGPARSTDQGQSPMHKTSYSIKTVRNHRYPTILPVSIAHLTLHAQVTFYSRPALTQYEAFLYCFLLQRQVATQGDESNLCQPLLEDRLHFTSLLHRQVMLAMLVHEKSCANQIHVQNSDTTRPQSNYSFPSTRPGCNQPP
jgi:hypothetical protein